MTVNNDGSGAKAVLLYLHGGSMLLGFLLMAAGFTAARYFRQRRSWFPIHRRFGVAGAAAVVAGFTAALFMVTVGGGSHFGVPHGKAGAAAVLASVLTPLLGQLQFTLRSRAAVLRRRHRQAGYVTLVLVALTALSGLALVGVLPGPGP